MSARLPDENSQSGQSKPGFFRWILNLLFGQKGSPGQFSVRGGSSSPRRPPASRTSPETTVPSEPQQRKPVTLDLDASDFLPISRDELLTSAKNTRLWGSPWFGRRDLIPPANDQRTKLIDRAMVSQGILTPEQLAEIHRVGAEMDHHRPEQTIIRHKSQQAGQQAAEENRAQRRQLKEQKKAEARKRKEERRAAIDHRQATDIVFLGRGVSGRLADRNSDVAKLQSLQLPVMSSPADLAQTLSISIPRLRWLAFHTDVAARTHYVSFSIPKKSGGMRILSAPHRQLSDVQTWILNELLNRLPVEPCAHGFVTGRSIVTNAQPHAGQQIVLNMDLENFFPGITFPRVRKIFQSVGYSPAVATILALLCTECPRRTVTWSGETWYVACGPRGLPQGACTSPAISNQVARRLDRRLQGLARKRHLQYTRYADDLTFSGGSEFNPHVAWLMARVRHIAQDEGLVVNEKKTRVLRRNSAQVVTGLVVNDKPSVSRATLRRIRAILHHARTEGLEAQNRDGHPNFAAWLDGYIAFIAMTRPKLAATLRDQLNAVRR